MKRLASLRTSELHLLCAGDVVSLDSSVGGLQHDLGWFQPEREADGIRINTSKVIGWVCWKTMGYYLMLASAIMLLYQVVEEGTELELR